MLGPSLVINKKLLLRGPNISYRFFERSSQYELISNLQIFNDRNRFLNLLKSQDRKSFRNNRDTSLDLNVRFRYKFGFMNQFHLGGLVSQEFVEYRSQYYEAQFGMPLAPFVKFNSAISYGTNATHRYIFGNRSKGGLGHYRLGLSIFVPKKFVPWKANIILINNYNRILKSENISADYIRGDKESFQTGLMMIWPII